MRSVLTLAQAELLRPCLAALQELADGWREPKTALQRRFVRAANGTAVAITPHEKAFLAWKVFEPDLDQFIRQNRKIKQGVRTKAASYGSMGGSRLNASGANLASHSTIGASKAVDVGAFVKSEKERQERASKSHVERKHADFKKIYVIESWVSREAFKKDRQSWGR